MPTQDQAKGWYDAQKSTIDSFEKAILEEARKMPYVEHGRALPCPQGPTPAAGDTPAAPLDKMVTAAQCTTLRLAHHKRQSKATRRFRAEFVPQAGQEAGLGIIDGEVNIKEDQTFWAGGAIKNGYPPAHKNGTIPPGRGTLIDERRIGWGLYQGDWEGYRPGITVEWARPLGEHRVFFEIFVAPPTMADP
jgi:hypothetical protein